MVGALLATFREAAGRTQRSPGEQFVVSEQQIASVEQGRRPLKPDLADRLDDLPDAKGALAAALAHMPEADLVPLWAEEYPDREREAIATSVYDSLAVPGQLQTEACARVVFRSRVPVYDEDEIEQLVATRRERREILHRKPSPHHHELRHIDEVARVADTRGVDVIAVDAEVDAAVTTYGVRGRRLLMLGLPLGPHPAGADRAAGP